MILSCALLALLVVFVLVVLAVREWQWRGWAADVESDLAELNYYRHVSPIARALLDSRVARSVVVWGAIAFLAWLDRGRPPVVASALFGWLAASLLSLFETIGSTVEAGVEIALSSVVTFLASSLGWLATHVADFLVSTGSIFAKVWEGLKVIWTDVLRPFFVELDSLFQRFRKWLSDLFAPVVKFLQSVRDEIQLIYKRFVKPVLDALAVTQRVLDILAKLHVPFAAALDRYVTEAEQIITANYLRLLGYVNKAIDTINSIVTLDGLFQRFVFLRSMERDAFYVWRVVQNSHHRPLSVAEQTALGSAAKGKHLGDVQAELSQYLDDGSGALAATVADASAAWDGYFGGLTVDDATPANA